MDTAHSPDEPKSSPSDVFHRLESVEAILNHQFRDKTLLEVALTHSSAASSPSSCYQRLEFMGDAALNLAVANHFFEKYPSLQPNQLSLLYAANISNEKLARVAVQHNLHQFISYCNPALDQKIKEFVLAVTEEDNTAVYGGVIKAPKMLADIVESIAAAIFVDCKLDVNYLWKIFKVLLEPIFTLETLREHPQPVTLLFDLCHKLGKRIETKNARVESETVTSVYVDGELIALGSGDNEKTAKLIAARKALDTLAFPKNMDRLVAKFPRIKINKRNEIEAAKQKLHEICIKMNWDRPCYRLEKEEGPCHDRTYKCSVQIEVEREFVCTVGEKRSRRKDSENSAATLMIEGLLKLGHVKRLAPLEGSEVSRPEKRRKVTVLAGDDQHTT